MKCPLCESENHSIITTRRSVPVLQNVLCDTEQKAFQIPRGDIELYVCHDCNFVFNAAYKQVNYESNYENFQGCSSIFDSYLESRAKKIVNFILRQKRPILLMEIGCGQGDFLSRVMKCVPQDIPISAIGFDPAYDADRSSAADSRCLFFSQYFDAKSVDTKFKKLYPIKICISRHVIEHIPNPHFLFECLSQLDGEVYLFLETPDVHWILSHGAFEDIVYEHCSFYSPESMCYLLQKYGFFLTSLNLTFNNQYMWIQAEKITKKYITYHDMEKELIYKWSLLNKFPPGGGGVSLGG